METYSSKQNTTALWTGTWFAVLAAASFGVTTPLIQRAGHGVGAFLTASLLYAGAAMGSLPGGGNHKEREAPVRRKQLTRLLLVALFGAVLAPVCLAWGLQRTTATSASLLLNGEVVFTVALAWKLYGEPIGARVATAISLMVIAGVMLAHSGITSGRSSLWGIAAIVTATLFWATDNTLTKPLADLNPAQVVRWKAIPGAALALGVSRVIGEDWPTPLRAIALLACGATGYGLSLRLYLLAQRRIGAGRTGSVFALAPFLGALVAWFLGDQTPGIGTFLAGALLGIGVYLHATENHGHLHLHKPIEHEHAHRHDDEHHDHTHDPLVIGVHSHWHHHEAKAHHHPHAPDAHHQHDHG